MYIYGNRIFHLLTQTLTQTLCSVSEVWLAITSLMYNKASSVIACNTPSVAVVEQNRGLMNSIQRNNVKTRASALMSSLCSFAGFLEAQLQMTMRNTSSYSNGRTIVACQEISPYLLEILRYIAINLGGLCSLVFIKDKLPVIQKTIITSVTRPYR